MRTWLNVKEEGYNKSGYMVLIDGNYVFYDSLKNVYDDFKEDYTNNSPLKLLQVFSKIEFSISEIYERVESVKDVETLQFFCKLMKCE